MKNKLFNLSLIMMLVANLVGAKIANAQYYGQTENKPVIVIDKKIGYAGEKKFFDNIDASQKLFTDGDLIVFKILIENKSKDSLNDLKFKDVLPQYLKLMFYPGIYNKTTNTIETDIKELKSGEVKEYIIIARIASLPVTTSSNTKIQQTNYSNVTNNIVADNDSAKYFVAYKSVPTTGANDLTVKTLIVLATIGASYGLRKKVRGY